jgi:hypothetical protein
MSECVNEQISSALLSRIVVDDLVNDGEWDFDYLAVGSFHLDGRGGQGLRGLHAADYAAHVFAVKRDDLDIIFAVERLQGRECFCDFHFLFLPRFLF